MAKKFAGVTDSGARQNFDSGSVRDSRKGKGRYDLITTSGLHAVACTAAYKVLQCNELIQTRVTPGIASHWLSNSVIYSYANSLLAEGIAAFACIAESVWFGLMALEVDERGDTGVEWLRYAFARLDKVITPPIPRYDLIPPCGLHRVAVHYEHGAKKYGDRNWEKGQPVMRYFDSGLRHIFGYLAGKQDEDHLAACVWNGLAALHTLAAIECGELPKSLDDRPAVQSPQEATA